MQGCLQSGSELSRHELTESRYSRARPVIVWRPIMPGEEQYCYKTMMAYAAHVG